MFTKQTSENEMEEKVLPSLEELRRELAELADWDERYDYLIDLGRTLPPLPAASQTSENIVKGCMSTVWLTLAHQGSPPRIQIQADSDSLIIKGLIVLLLALYQNRPAAEISAIDEMQVFRELGLDQHLSPQRRNGLFAMVKRIKQLALVPA